ncbi:hypothetical protein N7508_008180 [Penicillium antarcticum]|uniref:uncharacterized protein n=1 Tax=Penicillium antarcticum TaxID=416450 RepID=UPI0023A01C6F|nr:uncharacterized protein N7508_008180 [Penicillium antarcticum]KAJ5297931.1 hypothetical protein N7508_008180 [Penicillium antarcticum]
MRHFDTWVLRDPYSIWHYYPTGHRWRDTVRDLIHTRAICSPEDLNIQGGPAPIDPGARQANQESSPLLRLPAEIRLMIWSYVLTDTDTPETNPQTVHLVQIKGKIRHPTGVTRPPSSPPPSPTIQSSTQSTTMTPPKTRLLYPHTHPHLPESLTTLTPSLLRTCRKVYLEAESILYKTTLFDVDDLYTFIAFANSLSPTARHSISNLNVQWMPIWTPMAGLDHKGSIYAHTHSDELWRRFWGVVSELGGLRFLGLGLDLGVLSARDVGINGNGNGSGNIGVGVGGQRIPFGIDEAWVRPLLRVRGLKEFDLAVSARCDASSRGVVEGKLVRDVGVLKGELKRVLCLPREKLMERVGEWDCKKGMMGRRVRLAITAA